MKVSVSVAMNDGATEPTVRFEYTDDRVQAVIMLGETEWRGHVGMVDRLLAEFHAGDHGVTKEDPVVDKFA